LVEKSPLRDEVLLFERKKLLEATKELNRKIEERKELIKKTEKELKELGQKNSDPDSDARKQMQEELDACKSGLEELESERKAKFKANENSDPEPPFCKDFVESLQKLRVVGQVIGPWTVDYDTRDTTPAFVNKYEDETQRGHINHLHITASEPLLFSSSS